MISECSADFGQRMTRFLYLVFMISCVTGCSSQVGTVIESSGSLKEKNIFHQGLEREYLLYAPIKVKPEAPLVIVMHGYTSNMHDIASYVGMNELADEHNFLVAYPQGTADSDGNNFFNVGYDFHSSSNVDDVGFVRAMVEEIDNQHELNREAIFATGMSNGGDMSFHAGPLPPPKKICIHKYFYRLDMNMYYINLIIFITRSNRDRLHYLTIT